VLQENINFAKLFCLASPFVSVHFVSGPCARISSTLFSFLRYVYVSIVLEGGFHKCLCQSTRTLLFRWKLEKRECLIATCFVGEAGKAWKSLTQSSRRHENANQAFFAFSYSWSCTLSIIATRMEACRRISLHSSFDYLAGSQFWDCLLLFISRATMKRRKSSSSLSERWRC